MAYPYLVTTGRTTTLTWSASFAQSPTTTVNPEAASTAVTATCPLGEAFCYSAIRSGDQVWGGRLLMLGGEEQVQEETVGAPPTSVEWTAEVEEVYIIAGAGFSTPAIRWRYVPGGEISAEMGPLSWSGTVDYAMLTAVPFLTDGLSANAIAYGLGTSLASYPASASVTWGTFPAAATFTPPTLTKSDWLWPDRPAATAVTTSSATGVSVSVVPGIGPPTSGTVVFEASASIFGLLDRPVWLGGRIYRGDELVPEAWQIQPVAPFGLKNAVAGVFDTGTEVQKSYDQYIQAIRQPGQSATRADHSPIHAQLVSPVGHGEFSYTQPAVLLGPRRKVGEITKLTRKVVFGEALDETPGEYDPDWDALGGTLSVDTATEVTITGSAGKVLSWLYPPAGRAFSHMRIRARKAAAGSRVMRLRWGTDGDPVDPDDDHWKEWNIPLTGGGAWDVVEIPLYAERNGPDAVQDLGSAYEYYSGGVGNIQFTNLDGSDYSISLIEFFDEEDFPTKLHWSHGYDVLGATGLMGMTGPAQTLIAALGTSSTVEQVLNALDDEPAYTGAPGYGYAPGWSGVVTQVGVDVFSMSDVDRAMTPPTFDEALLSGKGPSRYLHGRSIEYAPIESEEDPESGGGLEITIGSEFYPRYAGGAVEPGDVYAQWAEQYLDYHAAWNGFGGPLLRCWFRLGTQYPSVVMTNDGAGVEGEVVSVTGRRQGGATGTASGTTNALGVAFTRGKDPNLITFSGLDATATTSPSDTDSIALSAAPDYRLRRLVWRGGARGGKRPACLMTPQDRSVVAFERDAVPPATQGVIELRFSWLEQFEGGLGYESIETSFLGSTPVLALVGDGAETLRLLVVTSDEEVLLRRTSDEGATWTMPITVTDDGKNPAVAFTPGGLLFVYYQRGSAIYMKQYDGRDQVTIAEQVVVATGVADAGLDACWREGTNGGEGEVLLTWVTTGGEISKGRTKNGYTLL